MNDRALSMPYVSVYKVYLSVVFFVCVEFLRCLIVINKDRAILGINCTIDIYDKLSFVIHYVFVAPY